MYGSSITIKALHVGHGATHPLSLLNQTPADCHSLAQVQKQAIELVDMLVIVERCTFQSTAAYSLGVGTRARMPCTCRLCSTTEALLQAKLLASQAAVPALAPPCKTLARIHCARHAAGGCCPTTGMNEPPPAALPIGRPWVLAGPARI